MKVLQLHHTLVRCYRMCWVITTGKAADTNGKKERTKDKMDTHPLLDAVFLAAEAHLGGSHVLQGFFGQ